MATFKVNLTVLIQTDEYTREDVLDALHFSNEYLKSSDHDVEMLLEGVKLRDVDEVDEVEE
jgi:hypothetical protein